MKDEITINKILSSLLMRRLGNLIDFENSTQEDVVLDRFKHRIIKTYNGQEYILGLVRIK